METRIRLAEVRKARGMAAADLAKRVGVSRQTVYAIEDGSFVPNTAVALRLARELEVKVEDLFSLDEATASKRLTAQILSAGPAETKRGPFVRLCRVGDDLVAAAIPAFPAYLPVTDGFVSGARGARVSVESTGELAEGRERLLLAGCDPALSLLAEGMRQNGMELISVPCASRRALEWLKHGKVHAAGSHLLDTASGDYNVPMIRRLFPDGGVRVVTFAAWEQGLVVASANPKSIRSIADLMNRGVRLINREKGSGSRDLLDKGLRKAGMAAKDVSGYKDLATGHLAAAYAVASGSADCCLATRSAARCFGLGFIPLAVERFDLSFSGTFLETAGVKALLDLLNRSSFRRKLEAVAGYDAAHTGEVLA